jgi:manganese transport protein
MIMKDTADKSQIINRKSKMAWWRSIGPALITACVVFGPGSLLISSNVGANHGFELLWLLLLTGVLMGTYMTTAARIGVVGGATPCTLVAQRLGRPAAAIIGINLCLICGAFQFSNNLAVVAAAGALIPKVPSIVVLAVLNGLIILFLFSAKQVYGLLERVMKVMVGVILVSFMINIILASPSLTGILKGLIPRIPEGITLGVPHKVGGKIEDPLLLVASLLGTTFSVAAAFYQGNLVREKGWTIKEYRNGISDSIVGVAVLTGVSAVIMITAATVIPGQEAQDIGVLARSLQPLLRTTAYTIFCVGLFAVAMNPFLINAMIGGSILADGLGKPARLSDRSSRIFTVVVLLIGMIVAVLALRTGQKPVNLIIFGQALTVIGNPLMAATILWLANRKDIMGERRNTLLLNILGGIGFLVVLLMAVRVLISVILKLT